MHFRILELLTTLLKAKKFFLFFFQIFKKFLKMAKIPYFVALTCANFPVLMVAGDGFEPPTFGL